MTRETITSKRRAVCRLAVRNEMLTARGLIQPKPTPDTVKDFWTGDKS